MKVILRQDVPKLGKMGGVVSVAPGYARNYLLPKGLAYPASEESLHRLDVERRQAELRLEKERRGAEEMAERLRAISLTFVMKASEDGRLFGSVTAADIVAKLAEEGFEVDKRAVELEEPLKTLGIYDVPARLLPEVVTSIKVWVVKE